jgi:2-keto-4-pentenoate hydratase/2-oxohepta-3-ene-1,7-dioic acid hydratase in catechol pathway
MAQRYVRVQISTGETFYGLLQLNRSVQVLDAPPWQAGKPTGEDIQPGHCKLVAPCSPSKIVAVGKNYAAHAAEMQSSVPKEPLLFLKPTSALIGDYGDIHYPMMSQRVDYEGELAIVIGSVCKNCSHTEALGKIWGYTIANDVTARDLQEHDNQWTRAKGFDTFCPLGPWIVRELSPSALLQTFLNGKRVQSAPISDLIFSPEALIAYISQVMTLLPGDVILTGTPSGIGPMQVGDRVRVEIEGIGGLENTVVSPVKRGSHLRLPDPDATIPSAPAYQPPPKSPVTPRPAPETRG